MSSIIKVCYDTDMAHLGKIYDSLSSAVRAQPFNKQKKLLLYALGMLRPYADKGRSLESMLWSLNIKNSFR